MLAHLFSSGCAYLTRATSKGSGREACDDPATRFTFPRVRTPASSLTAVAIGARGGCNMKESRTVNQHDMIEPAVPIGEPNALPAPVIWEDLGCWAKTTVRAQLNEMAMAGRICRRANPHPAGFHWVYWREQSA